MELLQTELSGSKQKVDQWESEMIKLQENNRILEVSVHAGRVAVKVYYCY